jgi:uncharacterized protein
VVQRAKRVRLQSRGRAPRSRDSALRAQGKRRARRKRLTRRKHHALRKPRGPRKARRIVTLRQLAISLRPGNPRRRNSARILRSGRVPRSAPIPQRERLPHNHNARLLRSAPLPRSVQLLRSVRLPLSTSSSLANPRQLSPAANRSKLSSQGRRRRNRRLMRLHAPRSTRQRNMSTISHDSEANQFTTEVDGHRAELDYTIADGVMSITHTRVPQAIGGRGIAAELMREALKFAGQRGLSINPACSYAAAYMRKHAQSADAHIDELLDEALDESFPASDSPSVGGSS